MHNKTDTSAFLALKNRHVRVAWQDDVQMVREPIMFLSTAFFSNTRVFRCKWEIVPYIVLLLTCLSKTALSSFQTTTDRTLTNLNLLTNRLNLTKADRGLTTRRHHIMGMWSDGICILYSAFLGFQLKYFRFLHIFRLPKPKHFDQNLKFYHFWKVYGMLRKYVKIMKKT